jgi:hypothetical protein
MTSLTMDGIIQQISFIQRASINGGTYVSKAALKPILTKETIIDILKEYTDQPWSVTSLAESILESALVTFAILIWIRNPAAIVDFVDRQELDSRLPFKATDLRIINLDISQFFDAQWVFLPVFLRKGRFRKLRDREVIPFETEEKKPELDGSYGSISQVTVDRSMHDFTPEQVSITARKCTRNDR